MEIITTPNPLLRKKSTKVGVIDAEIKDVIAKMTENSLEWESKHPHELSAAMAAPQLGINRRIIIIRDDLDDKDNNHFTALINTKIKVKTQEEKYSN